MIAIFDDIIYDTEKSELIFKVEVCSKFDRSSDYIQEIYYNKDVGFFEVSISWYRYHNMPNSYYTKKTLHPYSDENILDYAEIYRFKTKARKLLKKVKKNSIHSEYKKDDEYFL